MITNFLSPENWFCSREPKTYVCTPDKSALLRNKNMTRITLSFMKPFPSSWKIYMRNFITHGLYADSWCSYGHNLFSTYSGYVFCIIMSRFYVYFKQISTSRHYRQVLQYLSLPWHYPYEKKQGSCPLRCPWAARGQRSGLPVGCPWEFCHVN